MTPKREMASRGRWLAAVTKAAISRKMVPVLWDTGTDISRFDPYAASDAVSQMLRTLAQPAADGASK